MGTQIILAVMTCVYASITVWARYKKVDSGIFALTTFVLLTFYLASLQL